MKQNFLKTFFILLLSTVSISAISQCNTSALTKRSYYNPASQKEKSLGIRITAEWNYKMMETLSKEVTEMVNYIKSSLQENKKPDISKYIKSVNEYKKSLTTMKQMKETNKLDNLLYCFYNFLGAKYKKLQTALLKKDKDELVRETQDICNEIVTDGSPKIESIQHEIQYLYKKYPVDNE